MRKFFFAALSVAASLLMMSSCSKEPVKEEIRNWVWVTPHLCEGEAEWTELLTSYKAAGIDAVLVENEIPEGIFAAGEKSGVEIHLWWWCVNRRGDEEAHKHPEWFAVNKNGLSCYDNPPYVDYYKWVCPSQPEVQEYLLRRFEEVCQIDSLKGVSLDYVRYSDAILPITLQPNYGIVQDKVYPEWDYCYCDYCREEFKRLHGIDPMEIDEPSEHEEWMRWRWDSITKVVNQMVEIAHRYGKTITASVFPTPEMSREMVRQDWSAWNLDYVLPMMYHNFYAEDINWIGDCVEESLTEVDYPVYAGIMMGRDADPQQIVDIYNIVRERGGAGVSVFSGGSFSPAQREALGRRMAE
ncbi:MAG: family 10 glycosylhydrolase [Tidjanibacter sp.]|nr:family 10 glycosylhydrolase [Tidjanibacter sp.]MBR6813880.1 family 10 glycosylhydrolase [Tidjanibacter sp.]